jgi:hypothetical protein
LRFGWHVVACLFACLKIYRAGETSVLKRGAIAGLVAHACALRACMGVVFDINSRFRSQARI